QKKDFELALVQAKSLDRRYNEDGERVFQLAGIIASNKEYDIAIKAYNYIIKMGEKNFLYLSSKIRMLDVKYQKITTTKNFTKEDLIILEKDFVSTIEELGKDASIIPILKNLAHMQAFYLDKTAEAIKLLEEVLTFNNAPPMDFALCKIELADILLMSGDEWEATLLYSQVEKAFKNEPIGHLAKFKNAKLSFYIGEFEWAKAQLDVLKAATSKLIANDAMDLSLLISDNIDLEDSTYTQLQMYSRADLLFFRNKDQAALTTLDTIAEYFPSHQIQDEILFKRAEIYLSKSNYEKASENLQKIVDNYSFDILADDALFKLADLYENQFSKPEKAKELYQKILLDYPGSLYTVEARKRFRKLREGQVN
ncbi:MAG: tetratricopeptide repeat protein, partial [Bacteroidetes bacterium]|nr:tetratricopeptide repeat protein [Bacteroidota bacterium]